MSLLDDEPKRNLALEGQIEKLSIELHTLKNEGFAKENKIKLLQEQLSHGGIFGNSVHLEQQPATASVSDLNSIDAPTNQAKSHRPGVIVLGMHRSGTSILGGLLTKLGLKTGGNLIHPAEDNEKGFFERVDVVLQNDKFMSYQDCHYGGHTWQYDAGKGLKSYYLEANNPSFFSEGKKSLAFYNSPASYPWMMKDPRLCITFRTWLPLLNFIPSVLFTYRHPMDVAKSLNTRYEKYKFARGLKLWYVYNKRAIQQSTDLCRVVTSHHKIMTDPNGELKKIRQALIACGVAVPHDATVGEVAEFIDIKLQHGKSTLRDHTCEGDELSTLEPPKEMWPTTDPQHVKLYREVMRVYCAMEDGSAYSAQFPWDDDIKDQEPW
jgi:hypothetical protein